MGEGGVGGGGGATSPHEICFDVYLLSDKQTTTNNRKLTTQPSGGPQSLLRCIVS